MQYYSFWVRINFETRPSMDFTLKHTHTHKKIKDTHRHTYKKIKMKMMIL